MKRTPDEIQVLERGRMHFDPRLAVEWTPSVTDVWHLRLVLKLLEYHPLLLGHLASVVRDAIERRTRFRVFDCLKILRAQVRAAGRRNLHRRCVEDLFWIYKALVLTSRDEIQWCASRLIKDQRLPSAGIDWLIANWQRSEHIVNRLLLYPEAEPRITVWAGERHRAGDLKQRQSELVAIMLPSVGFGGFRDEDPTSLAWAIAKSKLPGPQQAEFLEQIVRRLSAETIVAVSERVGSVRPILRALRDA